MRFTPVLLKFFFLSALIGLTTLTAVVEEILDPKSSIEVTLSTTSPNRIMVEEGVITDVIFDENKFQSFIHQKTGQAFLSSLKEIKECPTSMTIITGSGEAQTFQVFAEPKPGEIIILKEKELASSKKEELSSDYHSPTVSFLNDLLWGNIPPGYVVRPIQEENFSLESPFAGRVLRTLEGPFEEILVLEVQNRSKRVETLKPSSLKSSNDLWVFLSKIHLEPGEKTTAIISKSKEF